MADNTEQGVTLTGELAGMASKMPSTGNVTNPPAVGGTAPSPTEAEQKAASEKAAAEAAAKAKAQANTTQGNEKDELTDEQVQAKLDELAKKEETQLTEDEKKFIEKYTTEDVDEITAVKQNFETKYGLKIEGDFTNDMEGFTSLSEKVGNERAKQIFIDHLESVPYMKDFYNHVVVEKRSFETFFEKNKQPDYKSIKIEQTADSNDEAKNKTILEGQRKAVQMDLKSKGVSDEDIEMFLDLYEDKGILYNKAKEAYNSLEQRHRANVDAKLKAEEARIKAEEEEEIKTLKQVVSMIDTNNFDGVSIPADDVKAFKEATTKVVDDKGHTLLDYKRAKLTLAQRMLLDYIVFKDLKPAAFTAAQASNKKFAFKKAAEENNARGGGRVRGAGEGVVPQQPSAFPKFDMTQIKVEHQTI